MLDYNMLPAASSSFASLVVVRGIVDATVRLRFGLHQLGDCLVARAARVLLHDGWTGLSNDAACYSTPHSATNTTSDTAADATPDAAATSDTTSGTS